MKTKLLSVFSWLYAYVYNGSFARWFVALAFGYYVTIYLLNIAPQFLPDEDATSLTRYSILRNVAGIIGILWLGGGMLFIDWITPGQWCKEVESGNMAAAMVIVGILYSLSLIICYA